MSFTLLNCDSACLAASGFHSNAPLVMLSMNQMSAVARCVASSHAVRDLGSGL